MKNNTHSSVIIGKSLDFFEIICTIKNRGDIMKQDNRKEKIDREIIKKEIIRMCNTSLKNMWPFLVAMISLAFFIYLMIISNCSFFLIAIAIIFSLILLLLIIWDIIYCSCLKYRIQNDEFSIIVERLISKTRPQYTGSTTPPGRYLSAQIHSTLINYYKFKLIFEKERKYYIPMGRNYEWSKFNCMDNVQVYENSNFGDRFYLVVDKNDKIIHAYNICYFELQ
ncbi:MAG: hypothetical protein IKJ59_06405 [Clostridia bacterium]|nr:hypothetical protein [Clostridia bacterium]